MPRLGSVGEIFDDEREADLWSGDGCRGDRDETEHYRAEDLSGASGLRRRSSGPLHERLGFGLSPLRSIHFGQATQATDEARVLGRQGLTLGSPDRGEKHLLR